jgi:hypothetical protein
MVWTLFQLVRFQQTTIERNCLKKSKDIQDIYETEIKSQKLKYFGFGGLKSKLKSKLTKITSYYMILNSCKIVKTLNHNNLHMSNE